MTALLRQGLRSLADTAIPADTTELTLVHCELDDLGPLDALPALHTLRILCCRVPERPAFGALNLRHLEINFSTVTSTSGFTSRALDTLRMFGLPLDDASRAAPLSARIVEQSTAEQWRLTRAIWAGGAGVCHGVIPGMAPVAVLPGVVEPGRPAFVELWPHDVTGVPPATRDALFALGWANPEDRLNPVDRFRCTWETGDAEDATRWLHSAPVPEAEKTLVLALIRRFPSRRFYRALNAGLDLAATLQKTSLPPRLRTFMTTVLQSVGTPLRQWRARLDGYERDHLGRGAAAWHYLGTVGYADADAKGMLEPEGIYSVGERIFPRGSGEQSHLAVSHREDQAVYEFRVMDLFDARRRGQLNPRLYPVFPSYASLLSHVVELPDEPAP